MFQTVLFPRYQVNVIALQVELAVGGTRDMDACHDDLVCSCKSGQVGSDGFQAVAQLLLAPKDSSKNRNQGPFFKIMHVRLTPGFSMCP